MSKKNIWRDFAVFIEGNIRIGDVLTFTPPEIALTTIEHRPAGSDGVLDIDMGTEKLTTSVGFAGYAEDAKLVGRMGDEASITVRGALVSDEEAARKIEFKMNGLVTNSNFGEVVKGSSAESAITMTVHFIEIILAGESQVKIDVRNMVREIGGVDQLEAIRNAIGR